MMSIKEASQFVVRKLREQGFGLVSRYDVKACGYACTLLCKIVGHTAAPRAVTIFAANGLQYWLGGSDRLSRAAEIAHKPSMPAECFDKVLDNFAQHPL